GVIEGLLDLLQRYPHPACFIHLKAYREERLLFHFHDAFDHSDLLVSDRIPVESVKRFCDHLGVTPRREPNERKRNAEDLLCFLRALENPQNVRILWPWWKKA